VTLLFFEKLREIFADFDNIWQATSEKKLNVNDYSLAHIII